MMSSLYFWVLGKYSVVSFFPIFTAVCDTWLPNLFCHNIQCLLWHWIWTWGRTREPVLVDSSYLLHFTSFSGNALMARSSPALPQSYLLFWSSHSWSQKEIARSSFVVPGQTISSQLGKDCCNGDCGFCTGVKARDSCAAWKMIRR